MTPELRTETSSHTYRYVSPPLGLPAPAQKTSVRRMAEGDSGEMSAFLNKHRALDFPSGALSTGVKTWPEYQKKDEADSWNQFEERSDFINGIETDSLRDVAVSPQRRYKMGQSDLPSARIQHLKNSASETRERFDRFVEKIFNGHNQQPTPTPRSRSDTAPTFPHFSRPQDYRFSPSLPSLPTPLVPSLPEPGASVRVTPHGEKATARSADSHWQDEDVEEVDRHFKRDAKYREYFEHKKHQFREHDYRQPHHSPARPVAPLADHFHGFSDDPILSQVGRFKTGPRFTKSISSDPSPAYLEDNQLHEFNEPLFYPAKQLGPASHSSLRTSYKEKVSQVTPGPGLFSLTSAHTASPLPHPDFAQARPRPAAPGYASQPLSYGAGPSVHSLPSLTTTASPWQFSPTPYTAYSHSSQERAFTASPTPTPYHTAVQHVTENNLEDSGYNSIEREFLGKYSDSFPRTPAPSARSPYGLQAANFRQETRNIHPSAPQSPLSPLSPLSSLGRPQPLEAVPVPGSRAVARVSVAPTPTTPSPSSGYSLDVDHGQGVSYQRVSGFDDQGNQFGYEHDFRH